MTPDKPPSIMQHVLARYTAGSPLSLMVRIGLEHCFSSATLDEVFEGSRTTTYTNELAFSAAVDLLGLVVTGAQPSVRAAYPHSTVGVTLKATGRRSAKWHSAEVGEHHADLTPNPLSLKGEGARSMRKHLEFNLLLPLSL